MSMGDTIPESQGQEMGKRLQAQSKDARSKQTPARGTAGVASAPKIASSASRARGIEPAAPIRASRPGASPSPDASLLREPVTSESKTHPSTPPEPEEDWHDAPPKKKRLWLWLAIGGAVVAAATVVVVLAVG